MKRIFALIVVIGLAATPVFGADIKKALVATFQAEGGYTVDTGGPTKYGISQRSYPHENIKALTLDRAAQLYERDYWRPLRGDRIVSDIIAGEGFDCGVNQGIETAIRYIQEACNLAYFPEEPVKLTGVMDPVTIARVNGKNQDLVYVNMIGLRYGKYHFLAINNPPKYAKYFRSWTKRIKVNVRRAVQQYDIYQRKLKTQ